MSITDTIKYIVFRITPHLLFDRIAYLFARKEKATIEILNNGKKNVYLFLGCDYANLGDYAITVAQQELLKQLYPERNIIVFTIKQTYNGLKTVLNHHDTEDIVTIIGGGNMGDLYYGYERKRNFIVSKMRDYRILSFPQTISFRDNPLGKLALKRSIKTYSSHPNLLFMAREDHSYEKMKEVFPHNEWICTPDVVMTLNKVQERERRGCVLSIRNDKESALHKNAKEQIGNILNAEGMSVKELDTCPTSFDSLDSEFDKLLLAYTSSKLIVTDRLHGMIFAYITGTPAIVLPNNNGKIVHCYDWIKECEYVHLINGVEEIKNTVDEIELSKKYQPDITKFICHFRSIL